MRPSLFPLLIVASLVLLPIAEAAQPEELFQQGKQQMWRGDPAKAAALFEQAIRLRPNSSEYHLWLANAYGTQAREANLIRQASLGKKAKEALERSVQLDPNNVEARFGLMEFYLVAPGIVGGSEEKARQQATEIRKRDALAGHRAFARVYLREKKPELARKEYLDAIREQPNSARPHYYYFFFLLGEKNYKAAFEELETAARLEPGFMPIWFRLGQLAVLSSSNYARGEEALRKYLAHSPAEDEPPLARAWYWLGGIQEKNGRIVEARQSYQQSLRLTPGAKDVTAALKRVS